MSKNTITLQDALIAYEDEQMYLIIEDGQITGCDYED